MLARIGTVIVSSIVSCAVLADPPLLTLAGENVKLVVLESAGESVFGELHHDGRIYRFRATTDGNDPARMSGTFDADGEPFEFTTIPDGSNASRIVLSTGGTSYTLTRAAPANPLDGGTAQPLQPAGERLVLRTHEFRDVSMGGVVSHTMLVPEGWTAEGRIEWSMGQYTYPQTNISVRSTQRARIAFVPAMQFAFTETDPAWIAQVQQMGAGQDLRPQQGEPPPDDIGRWLVEYIRRNNRNVRNVRLIEQKRDEAGERAVARLREQMQMPAPDAREQMVVLTIGYEDEANVPIREEIGLTYTRFPPIETPQSRFTMWSVIVSGIISAPADQFEQTKPLLTMVAGTLRPTPRWWTQSQQVLAELSRMRHEANMDRLAAAGEAIRRRAQAYNDMSDAQFQSWKKQMAAQDEAQRQRINTIREVEDYPAPEGGTVKLPSHYDYVYGDGKGNYVLTNTTLIEPGHEFKRLEPVK